VLKKAILRPLTKVRVDIDADGGITPIMMRLDPDGPPIVVSSVERIDDRLAEVWFEVRSSEGDLLTLRLRRDGMRFELHTVETEQPDRWRAWSS
jgi:hypothetical protein